MRITAACYDGNFARFRRIRTNKRTGIIRKFQHIAMCRNDAGKAFIDKHRRVIHYFFHFCRFLSKVGLIYILL